jgi:hypothetical protein
MSRLFESIDLAYLWEQVVALVGNPDSNLVASLLLVAILALSLLMVVILVLWAVAGRRARSSSTDAEELRHYLSVIAAAEDDEDGTAVEKYESPAQTSQQERPRIPLLPVLAVVAIVLALALGASTSASGVCATCHTGSAHVVAANDGVKDAHNGVECVACHEASGWLGSLTIEVPQRLLHYSNALGAHPAPSGYGSVRTPACRRCHSDVAAVTTTDQSRGVRMSHKAPLEAGAPCTECHTLATGVVSKVTAGMSACLRCHDGTTQPNGCSLCHTKDVSLATRSHSSPSDMVGRRLIETPDCGACHDQVKNCDPCHGGIRMPHTPLFMWWGHARKGVEDVWNNNGRACARCHTAARRPCTKCHAFFPSHPAGVFRQSHGRGKSSAPCDGCHNNRAYTPGRDFCGLCHGPTQVKQ